VRETSNPVLRNLPKGQGGYATFGTGVAGAATQQVHQRDAQPYLDQRSDARPLTIDDVVTKTGMTLGLVTIFAIISYLVVDSSRVAEGGFVSYPLAMPLALIGGLGGLALVMIASFGRKQDNPAIVLSYAALEGLFVGSMSFIFANLVSTGGPGMIFQAVVGTIGVFIGMLVVYKTGAIRVTPKFTRMMVAAMFGVLALALVNVVFFLFTGSAPLTDGGRMAIAFSLVCIGIAAFSFLIDFDAADQAIRAGAPAKAAWGIALGLTVTLVWLYMEILRLLSYFNRN
jgi:uncharacterized YccA/Bax inhibitor family protein